MKVILWSVFTNISYQGVSIAATNVDFVLLGFENWGPVYMKDNLANSSSQFIFLSFTICMAVATIFGALTAGYIGDKAGGYKDRRALFATLLVFITLMVGASVAYFSNHRDGFIVGYFIMIFTENLVEPIFLGIMLTLVKPHEREVANSMNLFV